MKYSGCECVGGGSVPRQAGSKEKRMKLWNVATVATGLVAVALPVLSAPAGKTERVYAFSGERQAMSADGRYKYYALTMNAPGSAKVVSVKCTKKLGGSYRKGDLVHLTLQKSPSGYWVTAHEKYNARPGEKDPGVYVFKGTEETEVDSRKRLAVLTTRFLQEGNFLLPPGKDEDSIADPAIKGKVDRFSKGDLVKIRAAKSGKSLVLVSIDPVKAVTPIPPAEDDNVKAAREAAEKAKRAVGLAL